MAKQFLAIDLGTTSIKGAALDLERRKVGTILSIPMIDRIPDPVPTRYELDPPGILQAVRGLLVELVRVAPEATGLLICNQMHSVVLTDELGAARSNVITWQDQRAIEISTARSSRLLDNLARLVTIEEQESIGGELRVGVPIVTLTALREAAALPIGQYFASLGDYVVANLSGRSPNTEVTNAAASGLYHLERRVWHRQLIEKLGLQVLQWPPIREFHEVLGVATIGGQRLQCYPAVGDQQCALAGAGLRERELSLNISTGSQASLIFGERPRGEFLVRPYFDGKWLATIVSVPAGRALGVLVGLLTEMGGRDPWDQIRTAVEAIEETDLEVDLSFFASLTGECGRIGNIHERNLSVGHLFVAAFRSMAANYARCTELLSPDRKWDRVVFSGSLARRFPRLRQEILAKLGNPPSRVSSNEEETLQGLLALALVCDGQAKTVLEATELLANSNP